MKYKRILLTVLLLLLCLPAVSCRQSQDVQNPDEPLPVRTDEESRELTDVEKRAQETDFLPELDYEGNTITTYSFRENYELDTEGSREETSDLVLDSVYQRNQAVERRLNVVIDNRVSNVSTWGEYAPELSILSMNDLDEYQIIYTMGNSAIQTGNTDVFRDVNSLEYLSLDAAWWWKDAMEALSFDGKSYRFLVGDICLTNYTKAGMVLVNSTDYNAHFTEEGIDGLYDLAIAGNWTVEELKTRAAQVYTDLNQDGLSLTGGDYIGLAVGNFEYLKYLEYGFDVQRYSRDEDGCVILDYDLERASAAVDSLIDLIFRTDGVYWQEDYLKISDFAAGNILFTVAQLGALSNATLREMEDLYGMMPLPKLDMNQREYMSNIQNSSTLVAVPNTCRDTAFASAVIEALCTESYRTVVLPFFEITLKIRYSKDSRMGEIIDLVSEGATKNFLYEYQASGGCGVLIASTVMMEVNRISSNFDSVGPSTEEMLRQMKERLNPSAAG